jgi:hypothetical protein
MAYKLLDAAQVRWRCVNAPHQVALVRAETTFVDGLIIEREEQEYAARLSVWLDPQLLQISLGPEHDREDLQPQLVDEVVLDQRAQELEAAGDDDLPA